MLTRAADTGAAISADGTGTGLTWMGVADAPGGGVNTEAACVEGVNCETYVLFVNGMVADWVGKKVQVALTWATVANEYDLYIHKGQDNSGPVVTSAVNRTWSDESGRRLRSRCYGRGLLCHPRCLRYDPQPRRQIITPDE